VLPPPWVRRLILAPGMVVLTVLAFTLVPVWLLAAAVASPLLPGRFRPLRALFVLLVHLALESVLLVALFALWILSGFGLVLRSAPFQRLHYRLVRFYLSQMFSLCQVVLRVRVAVEGPAPGSYTGRPLIVCCRHAGPGDSFLLVHALVNWYDREPRIVLKDTLQWDPAIDVVLNRLPSRFIRPGHDPEQTIAHIAELATALDDNDAFVIFPEGGNFTPRRRERAIARLHRLGLHRRAERAAGMMHVLAPRPGGLLAALAAAPQADVVWVAHTGLDDLAGVADVWRALPMDRAIQMRWWQVPAGEVPRGPDAQTEWLFAWWERIDGWIAAQ
jgi:1-acyl-sn-glycerol-3-phosphate acyltransferase